MKYLIIVAIMITLAGCSKEKNRVVSRIVSDCKPSSKEIRGEFILQCIKNANPNSDEEPEDWIMMCKTMAVATYCDEVTAKVTQHKPKHGYWIDTNIEIPDL